MKTQSVSIAIVDDHPLIRKVARFSLSRLGYHVVMEAENGKTFLEQLNNDTVPDICLLDVNMPIMNGFETIQHLKKYWPQIKVVFYTMQNDKKYVSKAMELGADGYVCKDASLTVLDNTLQDILHEKPFALAI
jgi:DNA-binding NarL/FixJ family response regulator